jgi:hypothetical protein
MPVEPAPVCPGQYRPRRPYGCDAGHPIVMPQMGLQSPMVVFHNRRDPQIDFVRSDLADVDLNLAAPFTHALWISRSRPLVVYGTVATRATLFAAEFS